MAITNLIEGANMIRFEMAIFSIEEPIGSWRINLQKIGIRIVTKARNPSFDLPFIFAIRKHIKENQIAILHCHKYIPWVYGVLASFVKKDNQDKFNYLKLAIL
jgi:hypothetical protein